MASIIKNKRAIVKGLKNNEKILSEVERTGVDSTEPFFSVRLPNIYKNSNGEWDYDGTMVDIGTLAEFNQYVDENEELYEIIKAQYPSVISTIWRSAFSKLYGTETVASKMLHGGTVDFDAVTLATAYEDSGEAPTINYIITKVNGKKAKNNPTAIKPYKKANSQVMSMLNSGKEGYFLPEITENGVVVTATKNKRLNARCFAVEAGEYSEEQIREYLLANAEAMAMSSEEQTKRETEAIVDEIMEKAKEAYRAIMSSDYSAIQESVERMNDLCSFVYRPDFSLIEEKAARRKPTFLRDDEFEVPGATFDDSTPVDAEETEKGGVSTIIIEGDSTSKVKIDPEKGKVVLVIKNDGGVAYETFFEEDGKTLRAVPIESEKQF